MYTQTYIYIYIYLFIHTYPEDLATWFLPGQKATAARAQKYSYK